MPTSPKTPVLTLQGRYDPGAFFDEMFEAPGARGRTTARSPSSSRR